MAVVSDDHADESYHAENCLASNGEIRWFSPEEIHEHNQENSSENNEIASYWACVDGFVVDATDFIKKHPGGRKKLLATNDVSTGDRGIPFDFSFSRGRNAHFSGTARVFKDGIEEYLKGSSNEITFPGQYRGSTGGKLIVLGKLRA